MDELSTIGALQFEIDYSMSGGEVLGNGDLVECAVLLADSIRAMNDDEAADTVRWGIVSLGGLGGGITGPGEFGECLFSTTGAPPVAGDFSVTVIDSASPETGTGGGQVCGAPVSGSSPPFSRDALVVMQEAIDLSVGCDLCECDADGSGEVTAGDALAVLRRSVGLPGSSSCPACAGAPVVTGPDPGGVDVHLAVVCEGAEEGCGNGVIELDEECDDGNTTANDGCSPDCVADCLAVPETGCREALVSRIVIRDSATNTKDLAVWKWLKGAATSVAEVANPTTSGRYNLCYYPDGASLAGEVALFPGSRWSPIGEKGYQYKDATLSTGGVGRLLLGAGDDGRSRVKVKSKGEAMPDGLLPTTSYEIQLVDTDTGLCWRSTFASGLLTGEKFQASAP